MFISDKIGATASEMIYSISQTNLSKCQHDSVFWKKEVCIICEERCTFPCTERIVEAAVSDSPPDLPVTDMQSGFPQLFGSAGLRFSFTHCISCQKKEGQCLLQASETKKKSDLSLTSSAFNLILNPIFLNASSSLPLPVLHVIKCCCAWKTQS